MYNFRDNEPTEEAKTLLGYKWTNYRGGQLEVCGIMHKNRSWQQLYLVKCQLCGATRVVIKGSIESNNVSCDCDRAIGRVFNNNLKEDSNLTIIGWTNSVNGRKRRVYILRCSVCSKDEELWPVGSIVATMGSLVRGASPCACTRRPSWTPRQYEIIIKRLCAIKNCEFVGFKEWKGARTNLILSCPEHGIWDSTQIADFVATKDRSDLNKCGKCSLSGFNENKVGYLYVVRWELLNNIDGNFTFIKFGITNRKPLIRVKEQKRFCSEGTNNYSIKSEILYATPRLSGKIIKSMEAKVKEIFKDFIGVVPKKVFPDGYTETVYCTEENIVDIKLIIKECLINELF